MTTASDRTPGPGTGATRDGHRGVPRIGARCARATFALAMAYGAATVATGAATGTPRDPYWAVAEVLIIVMALVLVALMLALHQYAAPVREQLALAALGAVLASATLTITVHLLEFSCVGVRLRPLRRPRSGTHHPGRARRRRRAAHGRADRACGRWRLLAGDRDVGVRRRPPRDLASHRKRPRRGSSGGTTMTNPSRIRRGSDGEGPATITRVPVPDLC